MPPPFLGAMQPLSGPVPPTQGGGARRCSLTLSSELGGLQQLPHVLSFQQQLRKVALGQDKAQQREELICPRGLPCGAVEKEASDSARAPGLGVHPVSRAVTLPSTCWALGEAVSTVTTDGGGVGERRVWGGGHSVLSGPQLHRLWEVGPISQSAVPVWDLWGACL